MATPMERGKVVRVEMDIDKSAQHFTRTATVLDPMPAPGGSLTILRLTSPVWYGVLPPRRARHLAVSLREPCDQVVEGQTREVRDAVTVEVYGVRGFDPEVPDKRWPHIPRRLQPRDLVWFGWADISKA